MHTEEAIENPYQKEIINSNFVTYRTMYLFAFRAVLTKANNDFCPPVWWKFVSAPRCK